MRTTWILTLSLLAPTAAQDDVKVADAAAKKPSALAQLRAADEAGRGAALIGFVDTQVATGAIYSGQYAELATLGWDATPMLRGWLQKAPAEAKSTPVMFREACISAMRDCVKKAPDDLVAELLALVAAGGTPDRLASKAKYALAQFGKTEHVDEMITAATKNTTSFDLNTKLRAWGQLADVYYNMRRYEDAAKAHGEVITGIEGVNPNFRGLASSYYNCACSLALTGKKEAAIKHLRRALEVGKRANNQLGVELLKSDMDIRSLRGDPAFAALMKQYFGVEVAPAKPADNAPKKGPGKH